MSRHGDIALVWGDGQGPGPNGEYTFRIGVREWRRLDELFDVGPYVLLEMVATRRFKEPMLPEIIRVALQAGKSVVKNGAVDDMRINALVEEYVRNRPMVQSIATAAQILQAAIFGPETDPIPKSSAAEAGAKPQSEESSPSPLSTDGGQSSDGHRRKSTTARSGKSRRRSSATSSPTAPVSV